jgi:hypothetical protein
MRIAATGLRTGPSASAPGGAGQASAPARRRSPCSSTAQDVGASKVRSPSSWPRGPRPRSAASTRWDAASRAASRR